MQVPRSVFDPTASLGGETTSLFNSNCTGTQCVGSVKLSLGSSAIDYTQDPSNPMFHRMVVFGGRGFTIYELPDDPDALLKLVYDSADDMERTSCDALPWAYNSKHTDDYASADNLSNNTRYVFGDDETKQALLDMNDPTIGGCYDQGDGTPGACPMEDLMDVTSEESGPKLENLVAGVACGRLITAFSTGESSIAWLYDITELTSPKMLKIFHLSPGSRKKSPGLAYNDGELGEIDAENIIFLSADESPSGKAAIIFGGSHSGSFSFWEFECDEYEDVFYLATSSTSAWPQLSVWPTMVVLMVTLLFLDID